jgi:hypothetical protein
MELFIGITWPLTVLGALYAGYRWGGRAKRKAIQAFQSGANKAKDAAGKV